MTILYSTESLHSLDAIWLWNAELYGPNHADQYLTFLRTETRRLLASLHAGAPVPGRPALRYFLLRTRNRGHGHAVVFQPSDNTIRIIDFFHTAQDWQNKLTP